MRKWSFVGKCLRKFKLQKYFARRTFWGLARLIFGLVYIINRAWQKGKLANLFSLHPGTRTVFKIDCIVTKRSRLLEWNISVTKLVTDQGLFCSLHQRHHALALFYCHHKQPAQAMGVWKRYCVYSFVHHTLMPCLSLQLQCEDKVPALAFKTEQQCASSFVVYEGTL